MERKRYLELCQINSFYKNKEKVLYKGAEYIPIELIIWFEKGKPKNSSYIKSVIGNSYIRANIEDVEEIESDCKNQ
jgi:hypothetical protein